MSSPEPDRRGSAPGDPTPGATTSAAVPLPLVPAEREALIEELVRRSVPAGPAVRRGRHLLRELITAATDLAAAGGDLLDLKIASTAVQEMEAAFRTFAPHRARRKVTIFGSARTRPDDPLYVQTRDLAARMAAAGWMVVTGAGPGIMAAGLEGAGIDHAIGVQILLPFEAEENPYVSEQNLVEMRYFFTRKLALIRESQGFVVMPGGFGTLDEAFELLTLLQTGKATPVPIVMVGLGQGYWAGWERFVDLVVEQGYASVSDKRLYRVTNDVDAAVTEITGFYRNFDSVRWVGDELVIRLRQLPTAVELAELAERHARVLDQHGIRSSGPLPPEVADRDRLELPRLRLRIHRRHPGSLRLLIDDLNTLASLDAPVGDA
jgi:uncharacterized protein (TIGR00730 family)